MQVVKAQVAITRSAVGTSGSGAGRSSAKGPPENVWGASPALSFTQCKQSDRDAGWCCRGCCKHFEWRTHLARAARQGAACAATCAAPPPPPAGWLCCGLYLSCESEVGGSDARACFKHLFICIETVQAPAAVKSRGAAWHAGTNRRQTSAGRARTHLQVEQRREHNRRRC